MPSDGKSDPAPSNNEPPTGDEAEFDENELPTLPGAAEPDERFKEAHTQKLDEGPEDGLYQPQPEGNDFDTPESMTVDTAYNADPPTIDVSTEPVPTEAADLPTLDNTTQAQEPMPFGDTTDTTGAQATEQPLPEPELPTVDAPVALPDDTLAVDAPEPPDFEPTTVQADDASHFEQPEYVASSTFDDEPAGEPSRAEPSENLGELPDLGGSDAAQGQNMEWLRGQRRQRGADEQTGVGGEMAGMGEASGTPSSGEGGDKFAAAFEHLAVIRALLEKIVTEGIELKV